MKILYWPCPDLQTVGAAEEDIYLKEFVNNIGNTEGILSHIIIHT